MQTVTYLLFSKLPSLTMIDGKQKSWIATSVKRRQYNGLRFLAEKERRSVTQILSFLLEKVGVLELSDEELHTKLRKLKERPGKMTEIEAH